MAQIQAVMANRILVFEKVIPMRWGDMDAMGHANNTLYFRYMEELRISWFVHCGFVPDPTSVGPVIINASCTFLRQFEYPVDILCRQFIGAIGRSSFETEVDMSPLNEVDNIYARGAAKCVWTNFPNQKSEPLPAQVIERIATPWAAGHG
jgi:acyl-CoA thioester hydrolase